MAVNKKAKTGKTTKAAGTKSTGNAIAKFFAKVAKQGEDVNVEEALHELITLVGEQFGCAEQATEFAETVDAYLDANEGDWEEDEDEEGDEEEDEEEGDEDEEDEDADEEDEEEEDEDEEEPEFAKGDTVKAKYEDDGKFYDAKILSVNAAKGTYKVKFVEDGVTATVEFADTKAAKGAKAKPAAKKAPAKKPTAKKAPAKKTAGKTTKKRK